VAPWWRTGCEPGTSRASLMVDERQRGRRLHHSVSADAKSLEFVTVRIENLAAGWRAKKSYRILSTDEFEETFSLAPPGKDFEVFTIAHLKRVK